MNMTIIVTDTGFGEDAWVQGFAELNDLPSDKRSTFAIDISSDTDPELLSPFLDQLVLVRIGFPSFADGRGFTIARRLRLMGYKGGLRAKGHIIADQYTMARRSGFDEVEIGMDLARRQPEAQWIFRSDWQAHDYQSKLRAQIN